VADEPVGLTQADEVGAGLDFEEFFRREYTPLLRALYLLTGSPADAEDIAQEAFVRVYERWARVRSMESPVGYVYRTALNLHRNRVRSLMVHARNILGRPGERSILSAGDPAGRVEDRTEIMCTLQSMPRGYREVLVLVHWLGLDATEAAAVLGIAPVSVRTQLHRARAAFRSRFGALGD
jgi:RNA polymerase sigma factor (sigma-70 family)